MTESGNGDQGGLSEEDKERLKEQTIERWQECSS